MSSQRTKFETETIERVNELVRYERDESERAAKHRQELDAMRRLVPWAFQENGDPKDDSLTEHRLSGRMD